MVEVLSLTSVVLVVPTAPAPDGNGLAMRAGMWLDALAAHVTVHVVVVPVSGPAVPHEWAAARAASVVVVEPEWSSSPERVVAQLGDPEWRARLTRTAPLPALARPAPPTLAPAAVHGLAVDLEPPVAVVTVRGYLAPFGVTLARRLHAATVVLDVDDDDERLLRDRGDDAEADAYGRLAREWLPDADAVVAASPTEAAALSARYGGRGVETVPNVVRLPSAVTPPPGRSRVLFVGNLTYAPNVEAARVLALEVLPALRERVPDATVELVGDHDDRLVDLAGRRGVRLTGRVSDVTPHYADADVVVVPLREGAGTRIKVLEAFAHERPVVATPAAVAGLAVRDGGSVLLGGDPGALAALTASVLTEPARTVGLVAEASRLVREHYVLDVVAPGIRRIVLGDGVRAGG
jgi:glycosyltransferase involved in cell wall biosynthesis